jgi:hypothetical protein
MSSQAKGAAAATEEAPIPDAKTVSIQRASKADLYCDWSSKQFIGAHTKRFETRKWGRTQKKEARERKALKEHSTQALT